MPYWPLYSHKRWKGALVLDLGSSGCSENKGTDQMRGHCAADMRGHSAADLRFCFRIMQKSGFLMTWLVLKIIYSLQLSTKFIVSYITVVLFFKKNFFFFFLFSLLFLFAYNVFEHSFANSRKRRFLSPKEQYNRFINDAMDCVNRVYNPGRNFVTL